MQLRVPASTLALLLLLAACADATSASPIASDGVVHPTGADQLVLRVDTQGGFIAPQTTFTAVPAFSLFGDGTLIRPGAQIEIYPGPALPSIGALILSEDQIQAILRAALDAGLGRDATYTDLGSVGIADAPTTVFTLTVNGTTSRVTAYALGMEGRQPAGMTDAEWQARRALQRFVERLGTMQDWVPGLTSDGEAPFTASSARLLVGPYAPDPQLPQQAVDWPLGSSLASFGDPADVVGTGWRCGVVQGDDWAAVRRVATGANQLTGWRSAGDRYSLVIRPLLPDEHGC